MVEAVEEELGAGQAVLEEGHQGEGEEEPFPFLAMTERIPGRNILVIAVRKQAKQCKINLRQQTFLPSSPSLSLSYFLP